MLNRIFVVDSVTLTSTGTAVSSYVPWEQSTRKLPTQVVIKATGQGAYVRLSNDNSAATNADTLVQAGDHVVLSVQGRRWVSVLSDGASSTVNVGALSTGVSGSAASLDLAFVDAGVLDPRVTFTRTGTNATYFNSAGVLVNAGADVPRLDYNPATLAAQGLLIEEQRTNFFTNASGANGGTIGTGSVSGPDNVLCRTLIPTAGAASFPNVTGPTQSFTLSLGQTVDWAISGWFAVGPAGTPTLEPRIVLNVSVNNSTSFTYFELQLNTSNWTVRTKVIPASGTEVSAPTITLFKPGLYRVTWVVRYTQDATGRNNVSASIQARDTANSGTYTADGISGVQYSLVQVETGSFVTSTIPTTTTALTRSEDKASVNTLAPWYNAAEGTIFANYRCFATSAFPDVVTVSDGTNANRQQQFIDASNGFTTFREVVSNTQQGIASQNSTMNTEVRSAGAYSSAGVVFTINGATPVTNANTTHPTGLNRLNLGASGTGLGNFLNGYLRRITYYPRRLSNAELQAITA